MTAMLFALQILPLALNTGIGLHLRHCLSPFKAITAILLYQIGKNKRVGSLLAIFRKNTYQEQIYRIRLVPLQNLQHLQPSRREKLASPISRSASVNEGKETPKATSLLPALPSTTPVTRFKSAFLI